MFSFLVFFTLVALTKPLNGEVKIRDMILDDSQFGNFAGLSVRNGISVESYRWPDGELPYKLSSRLNSTEKREVNKHIGKKSAHFLEYINLLFSLVI